MSLAENFYIAGSPRVCGDITVGMLGDSADHIPRWESFVGQAPHATIYHDLAWGDIFGAAFGYKSYQLIALDQTGACRGVLPLFLVPSLWGGPRLVAVPFRDRGGVLFDDTTAFRALVAAADALRRQLGAGLVELKTITPYPAAEAEKSRLVRRDHWVRSEVDLTGLDQATILKQIGEKTRNMIRQAERAGLRFVDLEKNVHAVEQWHVLHRLSQQRLGLPPFPRRFFERLLGVLGERGLARLFLVEDRQGRPVAGSIILFERARAIYAYSASDPHCRHLRPNDLMLYRLMLWLQKRGVPRFDLGSDSPHQNGLLFFKRKWLAAQAAIPFYYLGDRQIAMMDSSSGRFGLARSAFRHLPLPVTHLFAPFTRFFG